MVAEALDDLPDELLPVLDNVVVQVHDRHPDEPDLLGLYEGTPHTERRGDEKNYQKYLDRTAELKAGIERSESDIAALKRELSKLPPVN